MYLFKVFNCPKRISYCFRDSFFFPKKLSTLCHMNHACFMRSSELARGKIYQPWLSKSFGELIQILYILNTAGIPFHFLVLKAASFTSFNIKGICELLMEKLQSRRLLIVKTCNVAPGELVVNIILY